MGIVWRARDERLERIVAVKQLLAQPGLTDEQRSEARRRALREARIAARLHHANAIVIFDVAEHDGDPCLVMEYMASKSLSVVLADRGSLPPEEVAALGGQVASALAAAHRSGIVHRDIKPGNVLINDSGVAKITDFGIARATGDVTVTQSGVFAGTPAYLAPEVARGQDPTPASDVFSFGATLYDAVEGGPPFPERQNQLALLRLVAEGKVQPPRQAGMLTALLMQLLRDDPETRPTMAQASTMLAELTGAKSPVRVSGAAVTPTLTKPDLLPASDMAATTPVAKNAAAPIAVEPAPVAAAPPPAYTPGPPTTAGAPVLPARRGLSRQAMVGIAVVALVVIVGLVVILITNLSSNSGSGQANGGTGGSGVSTTTSHPATSTTSSAPTSTTPSLSDQNVGTVAYTPAGELVINFYNELNNPAAAWNLLGPTGRSAYGNSESTFAQYWGQFTSVSGSGAYGVTTLSDGSAWVPVTVTYANSGGSHQQRFNVRVIQNSTLLIDSDSRVPNT